MLSSDPKLVVDRFAQIYCLIAVDIKEWKATDRKSSDRHPWERARSAIIFDLLRDSLKKKSEKVNILDFGCGDLAVARDLSSVLQNAEFVGIDRAYEELGLAEQIKALSSGVSIKGLFPDLDRAEASLNFSADVVLLLDVLEHCEDDSGVLQRVRLSKFVNENTLFVITLPSHQQLWSKHDLYLAHFRRYNTGQLTKLIESAGFDGRILQSGYFFASLLLVRKAQVMLEKVFPKIVFPWSKVSAKRRVWLLDNFVVQILKLDYLLGKLLRSAGVKAPGLSCFAVFRRRS